MSKQTCSVIECFTLHLQERGTATEPPPRANFSSNVTQWEIFDAYQEDFEKQVSNLILYHCNSTRVTALGFTKTF